MPQNWKAFDEISPHDICRKEAGKIMLASVNSAARLRMIMKKPVEKPSPCKSGFGPEAVTPVDSSIENNAPKVTKTPPTMARIRI